MIDTEVELERPLAQVLASVEAELLQIRQLLDCLQRTISPAIRTVALTSEGHLGLQSFDLAMQQLEGLAAVIASISAASAPEWQVAARSVVANLSLQALADGICGETIRGDGTAPGICELL